ncbi:ArsR/SmtB family transcription factor [Bacteroidota bacterium]
MNKAKVFDKELQRVAAFAKILSHPARLMILNYLSEKKVCISGDITKEIPLSRTTVSQHLKELKNIGLIKGEIEGLKINYCLCNTKINEMKSKFNEFMNKIETKTESFC